MSTPRSPSDDVLSADPQTRAIELAVLQRLLASAHKQASRTLHQLNRRDSLERKVSAHLSLVGSTAFQTLADRLAERVDVAQGFGKFGRNS